MVPNRQYQWNQEVDGLTGQGLAYAPVSITSVAYIYVSLSDTRGRHDITRARDDQSPFR